MTEDSFSTLKSLDALSPRGLAGKREYVLELEQRASEGGVTPLVECLKDESGYLRDLAAAALVRLGAPVGPIVPLLSSGLWYTRVSTLRTLSRLREASCAPAIVPLLADTNESVRAEAVGALLALTRTADEVRVARALYGAPDPQRLWAVREMIALAPDLGRRIETLLKDRDVMLAEEDELLPRAPGARAASEEGVAWDVLTSVASPDGPGLPLRPR
jgi:HEAT repeat protein